MAAQLAALATRGRFTVSHLPRCGKTGYSGSRISFKSHDVLDGPRTLWGRRERIKRPPGLLLRHHVRFARFGLPMVEPESQARIPLAIIHRSAVHKRVTALKVGMLAQVQIH